MRPVVSENATTTSKSAATGEISNMGGRTVCVFAEIEFADELTDEFDDEAAGRSWPGKLKPRKPERPKNRPGKDTSSIIEFGPAIQMVAAARGLDAPVVMASELTIFRPWCGARIQTNQHRVRFQHQRATDSIRAAWEIQHRVVFDCCKQRGSIIRGAITFRAERLNIYPLFHRR